ncbi:hypothetical protein KO537_22415 [Shewanella sp. NKUCC01_JLK]|jgi:hypothetical protein|uniref:hypothetical protein n=1 Tax=Shewanella sp. NKUCC01_JLK TaxID=2842123 RepID=UPI001C5A72F0|nr:hypothetical protein [Shewanella sp. NKUCC01_JLK]MBW3517445.1 hypothetical protein [Shewanella sp. NKUCC01_JLK]
MNLTKGAAILCQSERFRAFLSLIANREVTNADLAAVAVREYCGVSSRRELNTCKKAGDLYLALIQQFNDWANRDC